MPDVDELLRDAGARWRAQQDPPQPAKASDLARRVGRRRAVGLTAAAAVLVLIAVAFVVVARAGDDTSLVSTRLTPPRGWQRIPLQTAGFDGGAVIQSVTAGPEGFVAAGSADRRQQEPAVWFSTDGLEWRRAPLEAPGRPGPDAAVAVAVAGSKRGVVLFVSSLSEAGDAGPISVYWSRTGRTWRRVSSAVFDGAAIADAVGGPRRLVAIGYEPLGFEIGRPYAWYSSDGRRWRRAEVPDTSAPGRVAPLGTGFVAAGGPGETPTTWYSRDGRSWEATQSTMTDGVIDVGSSGTEVIAITEPPGMLSSSLWRTSNGRDWDRLPRFHEQHADGSGDDIAYAARTWVMAGSVPFDGGRTFGAWTSRGGTDWIPMSSSLAGIPEASGVAIAARGDRVVIFRQALDELAYWVWSG